jgi:hypothetical protein
MCDDHRYQDRRREANVEQILINLIVGALGGIGLGKLSPTFNLGVIGNSIFGLLGGGLLGWMVTLLLPTIMAAAQSGDLSIGGIILQAIVGGAGGAITTAMIAVGPPFDGPFPIDPVGPSH